jgi:hypothetical protein
MEAMTKDTAASTSVPGASPQKQALLDAFDTVLKKQAEEREAELRQAEARRRGRRRVRPVVWVSALLVFVLCGYLYIARPDWLFPDSVPPESVAIKEASLRIGMANAAQHVEMYRQKTGKLPRTLLEAGTRGSGLTYQPLDSAAWQMVGTHAGIQLTLQSQEPLVKFLGNSFEVISRRAP